MLTTPPPPYPPPGPDDSNAAAAAPNSTGIAGNAAGKRRRKSRASSGSMSMAAGDARLSNASRQFSDGGGERAVKSASALAQEALTAGGALQTVEGREEGAVALRVRVGERGFVLCCWYISYDIYPFGLFVYLLLVVTQTFFAALIN